MDRADAAGARYDGGVPSPLRALPGVETVLAALRADGGHPHALALEAARTAIARARETVRAGEPAPPTAAIAADAAAILARLERPSLGRVVNATGVILQTNLGRAPLSDRALAAMAEAARGYANLEFDLAEGRRGSRHEHVRDLIRRTTGAEDGLAVNNNAAALLMTLQVFARGREVIVSRGEAVEIGGRFRIPDVLRESGAILVEVGTANRTYADDYAAAMSDATAAILRVHRSNFEVTGFTARPDASELAALAHERGALLLDDLGSGCLVETEDYGVPHEPTVGESLRAGADLALFSGDKLLGGPQCGVIAGRGALVDELRRHPLARALRVDKLAIAALNATLASYLAGTEREEIPIWRMLALGEAELRPRAEAWARAAGDGGRVVESRSVIGGGAAPGAGRPTWCAALRADGGADRLARALREADPPIVARVEDGAVLLDPRTVDERDDAHVAAAIAALAGG